MPDKDNFGAIIQPAIVRAGGQSVTDDETWVDGKVNPTLSLFDQGDTRATTVAVAFTPGNLTRGAGPSPNAEVAPTQKCSAGRGADDQRTCVAHAFYSTDGTHGVNQQPEVSPAVKVGSGLDIPSPPAVAHALRAEGFDASEDGTGRGTPLVPQAIDIYNQTIDGDCAATLTEACGGTNTSGPKVMAQAMTVRRLTPRECERLQAFPDDYTLIPWRKKPAADCPDGPRYKALGNSMAVNVVTWIGERIQAIDAQTRLQPAPTLDNRGGCDVALPL